ncbi:MAG TPA: DUF393 domain-containing protein [Pseudomonadota bacterium]|jgi:predicted DCC family thiol-disulfide oxidoreductase YuxK|nr:DUF393 domain-containing protein [Pseudomonadota bacterium]HNK43827.1 DUF393 domain-containing protein [Pseudomonadota bacterium]
MSEAVRDLLIFDGDCKFCRAQAQRLVRMAGPQIEPHPLQEEGLLDRLGITYDEAMAAMQLVTTLGRFSGLQAVVVALRHRPILGWLAKLYYVPGLRQLGDLGYRLVARYRYAIWGRAVARGECEGGSCAIHLRH